MAVVNRANPERNIYQPQGFSNIYKRI